MDWKTLDLSIRLKMEDGEVYGFDLCVADPERGYAEQFLDCPFSPDEHPEFDEMLGREVYSWITLWAEAAEEGSED